MEEFLEELFFNENQLYNEEQTMGAWHHFTDEETQDENSNSEEEGGYDGDDDGEVHGPLHMYGRQRREMTMEEKRQ